MQLEAEQHDDCISRPLVTPERRSPRAGVPEAPKRTNQSDKTELSRCVCMEMEGRQAAVTLETLHSHLFVVFLKSFLFLAPPHPPASPGCGPAWLLFGQRGDNRIFLSRRSTLIALSTQAGFRV